MTDAASVRSISLQIEIDAPIDAAWRALTSPEELARWFPPASGGNGQTPGDKLLISWGKSLEWWTTVTEIEAMSHIRWVDHPGMAVDWTLETTRGKTVVRIVNSGWSTASEWDEQFDATEAGWRYFLFNLKHYLERHAGTPRAMVVQRRPMPMSRDVFIARTGEAGAALRLSGDGAPSITLGAATYGIVVENPDTPGNLWLRIPELSEALLFVEIEPARGGACHCGLWLSTYGLAPATVDSLRDGLRQFADRMLA